MSYFRLALLITFIAGMIFGYTLKHFKTLSVEQSKIATAPSVVPTPVIKPVDKLTLPVESNSGSPSLLISIYNQQGSLLRQTNGLLVTENQYLVLPLASLADSAQVRITYPDGTKQNIGTPDVVDIAAGLSLWKLKTTDQPYYQLSETDSLFPGREFTVENSDSQSSGLILQLTYDDREDVNSLFVAKIPNQTSWLGAALLDPDSKELIGLIVSEDESEHTYSAIQVTSLLELLAELPDKNTTTLADVSNAFYTKTALGQIRRIQQLNQAGQWQEAILQADKLIYQHKQYKNKALLLMQTAFKNLIDQAVDSAKPELALEYINQANAALGSSTDLLILRANILNSQKLYGKAITSLKSALLGNPEKTVEISQLIRKTVLLQANTIPKDDKQRRIDFIKNALQDDPNYDKYHYYLGKLYLALGEFTDALHHLNSAAILNEQLYDELTPLINLATNKQDSAPSADIPLQIIDNNIYVNVQINDIPETLRFVLDTGASFTALSQQAANLLGVTSEANSTLLNLETANGQIQAPLVAIDSIALSNIRVENTDVVILESLRGADGLLGISFLKHFEFNIDQSTNTLTLNRRNDR